MKQIYINKWLAFAIILIIAGAATSLLLHTISTMKAQELEYLSLAGS
jgi:hypothetical protein